MTRTRSPRRTWIVAAVALLLTVTASGAQRGGVAFGNNAPYDGRFNFVRLITNYRGWEFDWPWMEGHLMVMFDGLTTLKVHTRAGNEMMMDDPELMKRPVAYLSEPGYWYPTQSEATGLRTYLLKGGFLIVDDFFEGSRQPEWATFDRAIHVVLPDAKIMPLTIDNKIFDSFFRIKTLKDIPYPTDRWAYIKAQFYGIYENNDPTRRLMVVINYDTDLGDYMEHSDEGFWPMNLSNDAYKFMMNYIVYGLAY